jgi:hypothetical protein
VSKADDPAYLAVVSAPRSNPVVSRRLKLTPLKGEYENAGVKDERLQRRLEKIAGSAGVDPAGSFPSMAGGDAELEGTYRFFSNPRVTAEGILAPHQR